MAVGSPWVVTGAAGFLGSHVVEELLGRGTPVIGVDDLSTGRPEHLRPFAGQQDFTLARMDIRDTPALQALFRRHHPAAVVHLAALHFIPAAVADPPLTV